MKKIVVILPAFNEGKYIQRVLKKMSKLSYEYVVIDDGSADDTALKAKQIAEHVLVHRINLGKGAALKTGCEYAFYHLKADAVVFMDSDDQHDPQELNLFAKKIQAGDKLVFGVRTMRVGMPKIRALGNKSASYLVKLLFGAYIPDIPSGYKAMTKQSYEIIKWSASDYGVELEIAVRSAKKKIAFSIVPVKTIYHELDRGMTYVDAVKMLYHVLVWRISI